ncbi:hypothetical protein [Myceligenerans pegani]|uniref:Alpha/beta fold hydrolase n=1 Tax=Myceligenerans pegani TaxID=2776917 RepID=A0ABR9MY25_9MICO|nr:hypothetical protein [Myceligenerans sp. TRM 65318]MBE1876272.1 hypothetical protein [Myceligenerans sp. TRM 65318]MBE3018543.1 hypothetical protein [Myceligenerans sp. TRM 65318]
MVPRRQPRGFTVGRIAALVVIGLTVLGLVLLDRPDDSRPVVPDGATSGEIALEPCAYDTEAGSLEADCGTLMVPENRRDPRSDLIALPVTRIRATGGNPAEPIFRLGGGPGATNMSFPTASRLAERHDVVLVGYRGIDGSTVLDCPEVQSALRQSADLVSDESFDRYAEAFAECAQRLVAEGVDLEGYSLPQRVDDLEAARQVLGYARINLFSSSAGTRTAMIYSWRYPESIHRSAMLAVNPPGRFLWDPATTDDQLDHYAELCRADEGCASRTDDLAASMAATAADMPDRWGFLPIKDGNVRAATMFGLFHTTESAAPLNAPTMFDAWLRAADGDPSGLWALSVLADLVFPESSTSGDGAASGMIDAEIVDAYYARGGDPGSILGNAASDILWGAGRLTEAWPASPDHADYRQVRPSPVETLLIGGTVDFSTPARHATDQLLPALPNGRQVILAELGHSDDFWHYQPEAGERLLTTFFDSGEVDDSRYETRAAEFEVGLTMATLAKIVAGALLGGALIATAMLGWMAGRVRRRGGFGRGASIWLRSLAPAILGPGGWFLAVLLVWSLWPAVFVGGPAVVVVSMGATIGLGVYLAWVDRDRRPATRSRGFVVAVGGSFLGAWLGYHVADATVGVLTALVGATIAANLALLTIDIIGDRPHPIRQVSRPS